ncbi:zinc-containing alcohol dehydrogenase / quinone oxidoreductase [Cystobacter fuscus DSM 2262]|uniref:Zinc-containing alcohol dehydrogenase / quinone oxidoreductase n=1 Tax=Cystobacter fuscus (strain ATCC 25194 / DSM 2262 / NBRC 100088 / M29) TaxID=1242864 RepID=S9QUF4_CYSF2|nr:NAD(P)-dependent alcohol dehydrogenase [Cystobacter fuscus]EPX64954.1 zinc-containing alcohol dehydrogenase / quinone oxidoreductase [Cystobacter fuscus DSM 2262]
MKTMNAIVQPAYGSVEVLRFEEVERPELGDGEVRVRVHAAAVCQGDVHLLTGTPYLVRLVFGLLRPKRRIAGQEMAGTVEEVGPHVTALKPGDEVYGQVPGGAFAEYVCAPADLFAPKPANLTFEQAAAVPISGMTALQGLRDVGQLKPGQKVLINGASGGVGTFAVQIAKALGAEVTAVCSTRHVDKVRSLGADRVIDYTREDFTRGPERYDVMLDLVGNRPVSDCRAVLAPKGVFVSSAGSPGGNWIGPVVWILGVMLAGMFGSQRMTSLMARPRREDLLVLRSLIEAGKVTPVIEQRYALRETAAALSHVAEGHAQGKTVIVV